MVGDFLGKNISAYQNINRDILLFRFVPEYITFISAPLTAVCLMVAISSLFLLL